MNYSILIVDDEEDITGLLTAIFEPEGYAVQCARNGTEALEKLRSGHPGIVLLDVQIPGKSGYEVCREVKSDPEFAGTKVLMLTGMSRSSDCKQAEEAGADGIITKPFRSQALLERVAGLLNRSGREWGKGVLELRTARLALREFREEDFPLIRECVSDPDIFRYVEQSLSTEVEIRQYLRQAITSQKQDPRLNFDLAVTRTAEPGLIGACFIHITSLAHREGLLGYSANPRYWKSGFATEAASAVTGFGFKELHLHRIIATCDIENIAAIRVVEKIGMKREGLLREHKFAKGRWFSSFIYSVLEQEWPG